jgi:hypothetical protein
MCCVHFELSLRKTFPKQRLQELPKRESKIVIIHDLQHAT